MDNCSAHCSQQSLLEIRNIEVFYSAEDHQESQPLETEIVTAMKKWYGGRHFESAVYLAEVGVNDI